MESSEASGIAFSISHNQRAFKLLELPPELLSLLESNNPPTLNLLPNHSPTGNGHALLSTPDKSLVYHVRQKNTSNPIYLLEPAMVRPEDKAGKEVIGLCSVAMIEDTLELYPVVGEAVGGKVNKWHEKFAKSRMK